MTAADDDRAIRDLMDAQARAWDAGDADAYGECFSEDCRYVAFFGGVYRGRVEIVESHRLLFAKVLRGTRLFSEWIEIRHLRPDIAIVVTRGEVARRRPARLPKVQSQVVVRAPDGRWSCAHFQNTKRLRLAEWMTYQLGSAAIPSLDRE